MTAAISEMLVQSHEGYIQLLPALPAEWSSGSFKGVRARGGFELDLAWEDGRITSLEVLSKAGAECRILVDGPVVVLADGEPVEFTHEDGVVGFGTVVGRRYRVVGSEE
jgi:alpha-L-fucosidase 2